MSLSRYLLTLLLLVGSSVLAAKEADYRDVHCQSLGGVTEYRNSDGTFTDCLTDKYAIEYDFARGKWYECVTQAGHYAVLNSVMPKCVLILESFSDWTYVVRLYNYSVHYLKQPIELEVIEGYID